VGARSLRGWSPLLGAAAIVVVVGIALRLIYLNARGSLWLDELYSVWAATQPSVPAVLNVLVSDPHPPVYHLLLHGWLGIVGVTSEPMIRFLSVLAEVAMLAVIGVSAARVLPQRVAMFWLVLLAVSPMAVAYGAEARPYALLLALQSVVVLASVGVHHAPRSRGWWVLLAVVGVLASSVHLYGALASAISAAAFGLTGFRDRRDWRELGQWVVVGVLACLPSGAWVVATLAAGGGPFALTEWLNEPPAATVVRDVLAIIGNHRRDLALIAALVAAGIGLQLFSWIRAGRPRVAPGPTPVVVPLTIVVGATFGFALVVSMIRPIWSGRYFIELVPYATLIVAVAADRIAGAVPRGWRRTSFVSLLVITLVMAGATARPKAPGNEDWRAAALDGMQRYQGPDTLVVAYGPTSYELEQFWAIYTGDILAGQGRAIPVGDIVHVAPAGLPTLDLAAHSQVIWLSAHSPMGDDPVAVSVAAGFACTRVGFHRAALLDCRKAS
jgi:hypothetical protein